MLLTAGERISMALLSMAINDLGREAVSFTGSQAGILTDTTHGKARIVEIRANRVQDALDEGKIVIVAGFQGVSTSLDVTTLGRGGSDTTAVALAAALKADVCEIYTDVTGVFTADPRIVPNARKVSRVTFEEMLAGTARRAGRRCSRCDRSSTLVSSTASRSRSARRSSEEEADVDREGGGHARTGDHLRVAHDISEAKVTILAVPDQPGVAARVFGPLAEAAINIDMIVQNTSADGHTDISFTLPETDLPKAQPILDELAQSVAARGFTCETDIAKVSVVGAGMKSNPGVAAAIFGALADAGINIEIISTSSIRVSCVVPRADAERAVNVIHERLKLSDVFYDVDDTAAA